MLENLSSTQKLVSALVVVVLLILVYRWCSAPAKSSFTTGAQLASMAYQRDDGGASASTVDRIVVPGATVSSFSMRNEGPSSWDTGRYAISTDIATEPTALKDSDLEMSLNNPVLSQEAMRNRKISRRSLRNARQQAYRF